MNETMSCSRSIANIVEICVKTGEYLVNFWGEGYSRSEIFTKTISGATTLTISGAPAAGKDNLAFYTDDGGATWEGFVLSKDSK